MNSMSNFDEKYGKEVSEKLFDYLDMILDKNKYLNLTAVRERDEAVQKHIVDSLTVTDINEYKSAGNVIDIGTGAGFPGALLAIADPDKQFVLVDSTLKRLRVIDEIAEKLEINNIETVHARAEELAKDNDYNSSFDICVSRAVAGLDKLCGWCLPFVRKGGYFIAYKGESYQKEIDTASSQLKKYRGKIERIEKIKDIYDEISGHVLILIKKY